MTTTNNLTANVISNLPANVINTLNALDNEDRIRLYDAMYYYVTALMVGDDRVTMEYEDDATAVYDDYCTRYGWQPDATVWMPYESLDFIAGREQEFAAATWDALHRDIRYPDAYRDDVMTDPGYMVDYCEVAAHYLMREMDNALSERHDARWDARYAAAKKYINAYCGLPGDDAAPSDVDDDINDLCREYLMQHYAA